MSVVELKPKASVKRSRGGGSYGARIGALEVRMTAVEGDIKQAVENTAELLALSKGVKGVAGFVKKHGPKALQFGAGIMTAAGIGNPAVWHFISGFFAQ